MSTNSPPPPHPTQCRYFCSLQIRLGRVDDTHTPRYTGHSGFASDSTRTHLAPAAMGLLSKSRLCQLLAMLALLGITSGGELPKTPFPQQFSISNEEDSHGSAA